LVFKNIKILYVKNYKNYLDKKENINYITKLISRLVRDQIELPKVGSSFFCALFQFRKL